MPPKIGDKWTMRILGLDVGSKTIGVAVSDELGMTAQGLKVIRRSAKEDDLREILAIIAQWNVDKIVVGLPKNMNGSLGKQADTVLEWIDALKNRTSIPVETWDERLSTVEASRTLLQADLSRKKRKEVIDKLAAVIILQGYLQQAGSRENDPLAPA